MDPLAGGDGDGEGRRPLLRVLGIVPRSSCDGPNRKRGRFPPLHLRCAQLTVMFLDACHASHATSICCMPGMPHMPCLALDLDC
eukprot:COSAG01_NODE_812_length_13409_cov_20.449812_5_plen_84_part_00